MSALPDRAPPELEPGISLDDLLTVQECDTALDRLTMAITSIEEQLSRAGKHAPNQPVGWRPSAERALRVKKFLLPRLQQRRAELARAERRSQSAAVAEASRQLRLTKDRALVQILAEIAPDALAQAGQLARMRHPDLYAAASAAEVQ